MEAKEINITYETLFEILKRERDITDLQKLSPTFFEDVVTYLNEKKKLLEKHDSLFPYEEKRKVEKQLENAMRIIKEIYERREKKILNLAVIKSRAKSSLMDLSSLLDAEKKLYNQIIGILDTFRTEMIDRVLAGKPLEPMEPMRAEKTEAKESTKDIKIVRFLHSVPKFVGRELEEYGPFHEEDVASLPAEIADLLIGKGRVEEINSS